MRQTDEKPMSGKRFLLAGVLVYLIFLIVRAPAGVMEWLLPRLSGERLHVQGTQGSLWRGEAADLVLASDGNAKPLGMVKWQVLWLPVLRGEMAVSLELATVPKSSRGVVALIPGGVRLRNIDAAIPVAMLMEFYPAWKIWQPGGVLEAHSERLDISRNSIHGAAEARWTGASSSLSQLNPFGEYRLLIKDGNLDLNTLSGPLHLTGHGKWEGKGVRFEGRAQADPAAKDGLQDFMRLFGKEDGSGGYRIAITPTL